MAPKGAEGHDKTMPLGHHHERGVVLPLAVSPNGGTFRFNVGKVAGCSSILPLSAESKHGNWCLDGLDRRQVESLSLEQVLNMTAPYPVKRLKIDAQGVDFSLLRATDSRLIRSRVHSVELEVEGSNVTRCGTALYVGQPVCEEVHAYMASIGFAAEPCDPTACETVAFFYNRALSSVPVRDVSQYCSRGLVADYTLACCKREVRRKLDRTPFQVCEPEPLLKAGRACTDYKDVECIIPTDGVQP